MGILQPTNVDQLKDNHPLMHKVLAIFAGAPAQTVVVDVDGNTCIGSYPNGKYIKISLAGQILLVSDARIINHLLIDPTRFKLPATNFPGESLEGIFYTLDFDKNTEESAYAQDDVSFRWDNTTDIEVKVTWLHDGVDAGKVVWGIEYKGIKAGEAVVGAGTTITQVSAGNHVAGVVVETTFTVKILHGNLERDDHLAIRLFRDSTDENDTLAEDARFIDVHFHITENNFGLAI